MLQFMHGWDCIAKTHFTENSAQVSSYNFRLIEVEDYSDAHNMEHLDQALFYKLRFIKDTHTIDKKGPVASIISIL